MSVLRVRQVLDGIGGNGRRGLLKHLPKYDLPDYVKGTFPTMLLSSYPDASVKYSEVGLLTEKLVLSSSSLEMQGFLDSLTHISSPEILQKIKKSKTTKDYLEKVEKTRSALNEYLKTHELSLENAIFNAELMGINVMGHPDAIIGTKIVIEVKTTSKLESDHPYFIQQLSAYMALNPEFTHGLLVLPLQCAIIVITNWNNRQKYLQLLEQKALKLINTQKPTISMSDLLGVNELVEYYGIGTHTSKSKTFLETVVNMKPQIPYQIFLSGNTSTKLNIDESDIESAGEWVRNNGIILYIHSPYIINLAAKHEDPWQIEYMTKILNYGARLGAKGVVVHVGKSTSQEIEIALENMTNSINEILKLTDQRCPLLLETPAGQGTEMLTNMEEFVKFIESFTENSEYKEKIRICVDTCHVFALGYQPSKYIEYVCDRGLLHLVHYNDSNDICGSCKDRHALVGQGHIGIAEMTAVADYCGANQIPMVIEQ